MGVFVDGPFADRVRDFYRLTGGDSQMLMWMQDWTLPFELSTYESINQEALPIITWLSDE